MRPTTPRTPAATHSDERRRPRRDTVTVVEEVPVRTEGLQLIGEMHGSGYRVPPALVRRPDGQNLQLTPLLYAVLEAADGTRSLDQIARTASESAGRPLTADNVSSLVETQLRPLGLVLRSDGSTPELKRSNPLLALRAKVSVTDPHTTRRLTDPFRVLFHPLVWAPMVTVFLGVCWWLLFDKGLAAATYQAFQSPGLLLLVVAVTVFSAGFHEFGHAAAARRGGAQPGVMGAGIYLVWPAFYTDVTDSYRLGRLGRVRTDLGGLYFNAVVALAITAVWWWTGWDALLLVVATQILQMIRQLAPLVRFDGYHVLADVTGVPDLYPRIGPTLASLWPTRWNDPKARELKPWASVITVWVLAVVPLLAFTLFTVLFALPRIVGTAWASVVREWHAFTEAISQMAIVDAAAALVGIIAFGFPVLAIVLMLWRLASTTTQSVWASDRGPAGTTSPCRCGGARPHRRACLGLVAGPRPLPTRAALRGWHHRPGGRRTARPRRGHGAGRRHPRGRLRADVACGRRADAHRAAPATGARVDPPHRHWHDHR